MKTIIDDFASDLKERSYLASLMFLYPGSSFCFLHDPEAGESGTLIFLDTLKHGSRFRAKLSPGSYEGEVAALLSETFPGLYEAKGYAAIYEAACRRRDGTIEFAAYRVSSCPVWLEDWFVERMRVHKTDILNSPPEPSFYWTLDHERGELPTSTVSHFPVGV